MDNTPAISEPPEQEPEEGTVVYVLHNAVTGRIYIGQPRPIEPEPEPGQ